jgi:hypothetical protein
MGSAFVVIAGAITAAKVLWALGVLLWVVVMYAFFTAVVIREDKPSLEVGSNGAWLIAAVATQSIAVLGALLADHFAQHHAFVLFLSLCMFLLGCMLYLSIITLIFYRFTFVRLTTAQLTHLLDQHGRRCHHDPGRFDAHPRRRAVGVVAGVRALSQGLYAVFLGVWLVVDSPAPHPECLAAPDQTLSPHVRPTVLGHSLPARHVLPFARFGLHKR